jgi:exodeoxyribonuclease V alpha subunit
MTVAKPLETVESGTVSQILFHSNERQIIRIKTRTGNIKVLINQPHMHVERHDHIRVAGKISTHQQFGEQLHATEVDMTPVGHELIVDFISQGQGVGKNIAQRLASRFGDELPDILARNDVATLASAERVSLALATVICNNFNKQGGKVELITWFDNVLQSTKPTDRAKFKAIAKRAYAFYSQDTVKKIQEDPYRVWSFSTWKDAEILARVLNVPLNDKRRLTCAVEEVLFKALAKGSTQLPLRVVQVELAQLIGKDLVINALYSSLSKENSKSRRFSVVEPSDNTLGGRERLLARRIALPAAARMERYVKEQLTNRIRCGIFPIQTCDDELNNYVLDGGHGLSDEQKHAVKMVLENPVSAVSGGAGTGKTSVLQCVTDIVENSGNSILQVALSGKAAQRMQSQTNKEAMTIESLLLKVNLNAGFLDDYSLPLLLIDEASMVDLQSMYRVLKVFEKRAVRIVFVGDRAQLAPVGIGLIYHKVMQSKELQSTELTKNFRSTKDIFKASEKIKAGELVSSGKQVQVIQCADHEEMIAVAKRQYELHLSAGSQHIIAATRRTVTSLNILLHKLLMKNRKAIPSAPQFRKGDKVIYKKNELEDLGIVNGSTGIVLDGNEDHIIVDFNNEGIVTIDKSYIQSHDKGQYHLLHAYALTCHSAQGSEFDVAIVVVEKSTLVEQSWLYTALTRARRKVILIEAENSIQAALDRGFQYENITVGFKI